MTVMTVNRNFRVKTGLVIHDLLFSLCSQALPGNISRPIIHAEDDTEMT